MRLIGFLDNETKAYTFYAFLLKEKIQNMYEPYVEEKTGKTLYRIWVYNEDDLEKANQLFTYYQEHSDDPQFQGLDLKSQAAPPTPNYREVTRAEDSKWQSVPHETATRLPKTIAHPLTYLIILICAILFMWNSFEEKRLFDKGGDIAVEIGWTPLDKALLFDDPASERYIQQMIDTVPLTPYKELKDLPPEALAFIKKAEDTPSWRGVFAFFTLVNSQGWKAALATPLFEKIRHGELWRLFTPSLMHANILHILFNMIWVWLLCKQIEERVSPLKLSLMIILIGVVSNIAEYLMAGPYFLGFSGIVVGMAGFIWMRQKKAPWEGYPLPKATLLFLLIFVLGMVVIELLAFMLHLFSPLHLTPGIANTGHIVGGLMGIWLGRFSFFARRAA